DVDRHIGSSVRGCELADERDVLTGHWGRVELAGHRGGHRAVVLLVLHRHASGENDLLHAYRGRAGRLADVVVVSIVASQLELADDPRRAVVRVHPDLATGDPSVYLEGLELTEERGHKGHIVA